MNKKSIPITAVKELAKKYGYTQIVVHGYDGETGTESVATWGKTIADCENAARGGNAVKKLLGWPEEQCNAKPKRSKS
jgi:hypothetical protein